MEESWIAKKEWIEDRGEITDFATGKKHRRRTTNFGWVSVPHAMALIS